MSASIARKRARGGAVRTGGVGDAARKKVPIETSIEAKSTTGSMGYGYRGGPHCDLNERKAPRPRSADLTFPGAYAENGLSSEVLDSAFDATVPHEVGFVWANDSALI